METSSQGVRNSWFGCTKIEILPLISNIFSSDFEIFRIFRIFFRLLGLFSDCFSRVYEEIFWVANPLGSYLKQGILEYTLPEGSRSIGEKSGVPRTHWLYNECTSEQSWHALKDRQTFTFHRLLVWWNVNEKWNVNIACGCVLRDAPKTWIAKNSVSKYSNDAEIKKN